MESSLDQETRLIDDLLDMARINTGKLTLKRQAVDLAACLRAAADAVRPKAEARRQTLDVAPGDSFPLLLADPVRLRQVATQPARQRQQVHAGGRPHHPGGAARGEPGGAVSVSDTGPGIDPAFLPHVFEPFRQADSSSRRQHGGLGLGLSIVRHIVELHGGQVQAANRPPGPGACFTVWFPIVPAPAPPPPPPPVDLGRTARAAGGRLGRHRRGAVAPAGGEGPERAPGRARGAGAGAGPRTSRPTSSSPTSACRTRTATTCCNLVHADPQLRDVPVIAATGYVGSSEQTRMAEMGFAATLSKPFDLDELLRTLAQVRRR